MRTIGFDIVAEQGRAVPRRHRPVARDSPTPRWPLAVHAEYTSDPAALREADFIIVAVPTPVDDAHIPDFGPLIGASRSVGRAPEAAARR